MISLATLDLEKAGKHGFALLPGHGIVKDVYTLSTAMGKEAEKAADSVEKAASGEAEEEEEEED
ncbi:hypothetical protein [Rufibacter sp. XAAS-G3-1]|uniref:hypothetical protein n=1 Tax=Rufibacter sp. XAAS-G3-1 TaxID=2729134 RepID=UPI0015E6BD74|nr:hypothetical protein [Rufibacter sp. XAAS-G3-1]